MLENNHRRKRDKERGWRGRYVWARHHSVAYDDILRRTKCVRDLLIGEHTRYVHPCCHRKFSAPQSIRFYGYSLSLLRSSSGERRTRISLRWQWIFLHINPYLPLPAVALSCGEKVMIFLQATPIWGLWALIMTQKWRVILRTRMGFATHSSFHLHALFEIKTGGAKCLCFHLRNG